MGGEWNGNEKGAHSPASRMSQWCSAPISSGGPAQVVNDKVLAPVDVALDESWGTAVAQEEFAHFFAKR